MKLRISVLIIIVSSFSLQAQSTHLVNVNISQIPCVVGINESPLQNKVNIYPNPFHEFIKIEIPNELLNKNISFSIYNILGNMVIQNQTTIVNTQNLLELNVSELNSGIYFIRIYNGDVDLKKKLVKK